MTTKNELLNTLNELRAAHGDDEIVKFSKSKSELENVISEYRDSIGDDGTMSVADLARELGMSPKIARAKLRRRGIFATNGAHVRFVRDDELFVKYHAIITSARVAVVADNA